MDRNDILSRQDVPADVRDEIDKLSSQVEQSTKKVNECALLINEMIDGFALHEIICDDSGDPVDYRFLDVNPAFEKLTSLKRADVIGKTVREVLPDIEESWIRRYGQVALTGEGIQFEDYFPALNRFYSIRAYSPRRGQFAVIFTDITKQKQLEEQFRHAQKMDAIGRFAGGFSHDFNNQLTAIVGYADMIMSSLDESDPLYRMICKIRSAGIKSATLARQLLLFSRKHTLEMCNMNLNTSVSNLKRLFRRIIREDIELTIFLEPDLGVIQGDVTHIEQLLVNLAVNARDAMPSGGKLTIQTMNVTIDEEYVDMHPGFKNGEYVMISVSDNGIGMDAETREHILEPFYTTKGPEGRTGLGMSTVYDIVQQHNGHLLIHSEPGKGTTFKIYFPMSKKAALKDTGQEQERSLPNGTETILLVEDEEIVRKLATTILKALGYKVITASMPEKALLLIQKAKNKPALLVSDVIMPQMNGKELFQQLEKIVPELRVLYISGYPGNVLENHGILGKEENFLPKPFSVRVFAQKVRTLLDT